MIVKTRYILTHFHHNSNGISDVEDSCENRKNSCTFSSLCSTYVSIKDDRRKLKKFLQIHPSSRLMLEISLQSLAISLLSSLILIHADSALLVIVSQILALLCSTALLKRRRFHLSIILVQLIKIFK